MADWSPYLDDPYRFHGSSRALRHNDDAACRESATANADPGVEGGGLSIVPNYIHTPTGEGPVFLGMTFDDAGGSVPQFYYLDSNGDLQMTTGGAVGVNPAAQASQAVGTYHNDYFAPIGSVGVTVTAANIIADAIAAGALVFSGGVGAPVTAAEFLASIDIDLKPVNGHGNIAGTQETSTTSQATVNDGSVTDMDPGASRTVGGLMNGGFREPTNFAEIVIAEGSIVTIGATIATIPA